MSGESGGTSRLNVAYNIHCDLVAEREVSVVIYLKFFITFAVDLHLKYGIRPISC